MLAPCEIQRDGKLVHIYVADSPEQALAFAMTSYYFSPVLWEANND